MMKDGLLKLVLNLDVFIMKFKILPGYPTYEIKLTARDKYLLTVFVVCCVMVAWMVGELIVHAK